MLATSFKTDANGSGLDHHDPARVAAIADYEIVDTVSEAEFNHIVELTASLFQTPASMISIIGEEFQFFIARTGLEVSSTPVAVSFCVNALESDKPFVINDVRENDCFASNPLVLGPPYIRFYAGAPLRTASGLVLGTLCIID